MPLVSEKVNVTATGCHGDDTASFLSGIITMLSLGVCRYKAVTSQSPVSMIKWSTWSIDIYRSYVIKRSLHSTFNGIFYNGMRACLREVLDSDDKKVTAFDVIDK